MGACASSSGDGDSYYVTVDGVKCDRSLVDACAEAVKGQGDGRVSQKDAEIVFAKAADGSKITRCERWTLRYCLTAFKWTEPAVTYLEEQMKAAKHEDGGNEEPEEPKTKKAKSYYETIDGMKLDASLVETCREAVKGQGDGRISVEDSKKVWEKAMDGGKVTNIERWTIRYCVTEFKWTEAALDHFHEEIKKVEDDHKE